MSEILVNTIKKADGTGSITVPADSGTLLTSVSSIPVANLDSAVGITMVDQFRLTAAITSSGVNQNQILNNNWERTDDGSFAQLGTGMTEAAGVFTFPQTGLYQVIAVFGALMENTGAARYWYSYIEHSNNSGSSWDYVCATLNSVPNVTASTDFGSTTVNAILNITDASTHRVRFSFTTDSASLKIDGADTQNHTHMTFIRLGDSQ